MTKTLLSAAILSALLLGGCQTAENYQTTLQKIAQSPSPNPDVYQSTIQFSDINSYTMRWIYSDSSDNNCLFGSESLEYDTNDFLWGWKKTKDGTYTAEPINPGEGPLLYIHKIIDIRWHVTDNRCMVAIEMQAAQNNEQPKYVWWVLNFGDSFSEGKTYSEQPEMWKNLNTGIQVR